uniref:MULE transposase domain-containing protein n=1 Tax=Meloidogyne javanica TaxID=6303 RepID=A0A915LSJ2_MELJA
MKEFKGEAADGWIRGQINLLNLGGRNALFPIEHWNMVERLAEGLSRTNNSIEGWHSAWNSHLRSNPRLSVFCRKMIEEDKMWTDRVADYQAAPADGIRGRDSKRKEKYIRQDANLLTLIAEFNDRDPLVYLRACAYHLHF